MQTFFRETAANMHMRHMSLDAEGASEEEEGLQALPITTATSAEGSWTMR
jgi:hypothetical protein